MEIIRFVWDIVDSNSWLIIDNNKGILIDAIINPKLFAALDELEEITIILSHSHFDHIIGLNTIRSKRSDVIVVSSQKCSENIGNIYRNMSSSATAFLKFYEAGKKSNIEIEPFICNPVEVTCDKDMLFDWNSHCVELHSVHGHSDDGLLVIIDKTNLFSGDTLLNIPTVTRLPRGNTKRFWREDIPMMKNMKDVKFVFPGHGLPGELKDMLAVNIPPQNL